MNSIAFRDEDLSDLAPGGLAAPDALNHKLGREGAFEPLLMGRSPSKQLVNISPWSSGGVSCNVSTGEKKNTGHEATAPGREEERWCCDGLIHSEPMSKGRVLKSRPRSEDGSSGILVSVTNMKPDKGTKRPRSAVLAFR
ncbi:hypothetical protein DNTS_020287 [Danionella cerebrum]|uniref:Uncharacterized protein n=1 Tax=Danionella cerebrum TaxID=2873325 RepID=A0A553Q0G2_9TELE|nr:hypothetical protein DNTS_020287 [Danionella translucida]